MKRLRLFFLILFIAAECARFNAHAGENVFREFGKDAAKAGKQAGKATKKVGKDIGRAGKKAGKAIKDESQHLFQD